MTFMRRKLSTLFFVLIIPIFFIAGCSSNSQQSNSNKIKLNFFNQKPEISSQYQKLAKMYTKEHPNVSIQITTSGQGGGAAALQAKFASGEAPDIIMLGGLPEIDRYKDHLVSLQGLPATKTILPSLRSGGISEKRLVGLPVDLEAYGWSYNKAVFAKAGVNAAAIHNYADFVRAVKKIDAQKDKLGLSGVFGFNGADTNSIASVSAQFTSQAYDNDQVKAFKSTEFPWKYGTQMHAYYTLIRNYSVQPILSVKYDPSVQDLFYNGKVAMIPQGNWIVPTLDGIEKGFVQKNLGMLPFFTKNDGSDRLLTGSSWYLGVTNDHPKREKAAKDFVNWMFTSRDAENVIINEMRFVPATKNFDVTRLPDDLSKDIYRIGSAKNARAPIHKQYPNGFSTQVLGPYIQRYFVYDITWKQLEKVVTTKYRQLREIQSGE
ncbi:multiple sugar ABC transporter [Liquorilactobacillus sucicola DSM 21376 = JCM 15457]|nr:ABC transporter substrate-binding protein [Liquorilactobacillus sucicola]GAJ26598.1 multiple sugar ABC transporter [Liquorilactobacillus sucicola DSM 21376 = JCM 15457]